jgi:uncharacterized Rmd1/YagE family protein
LFKIDRRYILYTRFNYILLLCLKYIVRDFLYTLKTPPKNTLNKKSTKKVDKITERELITKINYYTGNSYNIVNLIRFNQGRRELSIYTYIRYILYSGYIY